ncbi:MAG: 1-acyl-sn-glycerol-3-phosphate acyltransferase [Chitinophagales bacterium]
MFNWFFRLVFRLFGWKVDPNLPEGAHNSVMLAAPHTSNWDFPFTIAAFDILNVAVRFTVKKELNFFPLGWILNSLGAIWVDRSPKKEGEKRRSMVDVMTELFEDRDKLVVLVTPEGTRSKQTMWKTGFYHVAMNANVPIALGYIDFKTKIAGVGKVIYPSGNMEKDMREIMEFYNTINPKIPANFSVDVRYFGEGERVAAQ